MMNKQTIKILNSLSAREITLLYTLYNLRCLKTSQIFDNFYKEKNGKILTDAYCKKRLSFLVNNGVIEKHSFDNEHVYFLTNIGVDFVKTKYSLPSNILDEKKNVIKRGYFRSSELKIIYKNIRHQLHLNQFALDLKKLNLPGPNQYYDEKHLVYYKDIRPDGLYSTLEIDFFLEMDMGTESVAQLKQKWLNYRNFLLSNDFKMKDKKLIMLFIVEGVTFTDQRINLIERTLHSELSDMFRNHFEIIVGTHAQLLETIKYYVAEQPETKYAITNKLRELGFSFGETSKLSERINNYDFDFFVKNSSGELYVIDDFLTNKMSISSKMTFYNEINSYFRNIYKRELKYIIFCRDEAELFSYLRALNLEMPLNTYFAVYNNLIEANSLHEALRYMDSIGNIFKYKDSALQHREFDKVLFF